MFEYLIPAIVATVGALMLINRKAYTKELIANQEKFVRRKPLSKVEVRIGEISVLVVGSIFTVAGIATIVKMAAKQLSGY